MTELEGAVLTIKEEIGLDMFQEIGIEKIIGAKVGYITHPVTNDPRNAKELAFVLGMNKLLERDSDFFYGQLFKGYIGPVTDHDIKMTMTVIQWLGTSCGQGFIEQVNKDYDEAVKKENDKIITELK